MLEMEWESVLTGVVNSKNLYEDIKNMLDGMEVKFNPDARVMIACDTRESSPRLIQALSAGISSLGVTIKDFGLLTTPQLHF